ncbi:hypothetical protein JCM6882_008710 [Rhodosporidiobolus microsporus]
MADSASTSSRGFAGGASCEGEQRSPQEQPFEPTGLHGGRREQEPVDTRASLTPSAKSIHPLKGPPPAPTPVPLPSQTPSANAIAAASAASSSSPTKLGPLPLGPTSTSSASLALGATFDKRAALEEAAYKRCYQHGFRLVVYRSPASFNDNSPHSGNWDGYFELACSLRKTPPAGKSPCPFKMVVFYKFRSGVAEQWTIKTVVNEHNHPRLSQDELGSYKKPEIRQKAPRVKGEKAKKLARASRSEAEESSSSDGDESDDSSSEDEIVAALPNTAKRSRLEPSASRTRRSSTVSSVAPSLSADLKVDHPFPLDRRRFRTLREFYTVKDEVASEGGFKLYSGGGSTPIKFECAHGHAEQPLPPFASSSSSTGPSQDVFAAFTVGQPGPASILPPAHPQLSPNAPSAATPLSAYQRQLEALVQQEEAQAAKTAPSPSSGATPSKPRGIEALRRKRAAEATTATTQGASVGLEGKKQEEPKEQRKKTPSLPATLDLTLSSDEEEDVKPVLDSESLESGNPGKRIKREPSSASSARNHSFAGSSSHIAPSPAPAAPSSPPAASEPTVASFLASLDPALNLARLAPFFELAGFTAARLEVVRPEDVEDLIEVVTEEVKKQTGKAPEGVDAFEWKTLGRRLAARK